MAGENYKCLCYYKETNEKKKTLTGSKTLLHYYYTKHKTNFPTKNFACAYRRGNALLARSKSVQRGVIMSGGVVMAVVMVVAGVCWLRRES